MPKEAWWWPCSTAWQALLLPRGLLLLPLLLTLLQCDKHAGVISQLCQFGCEAACASCCTLALGALAAALQAALVQPKLQTGLAS
jgi:hypothetical protein